MREQGIIEASSGDGLYTVKFKEKFLSVPKIYFTILPNSTTISIQLDLEHVDKELARFRINSIDNIKILWSVDGDITAYEYRGSEVNYFM